MRRTTIAALTLALFGALVPTALADDTTPDANDVADECRDQAGAEFNSDANSHPPCKAVEAVGEGTAHGCRDLARTGSTTVEECDEIDGQALSDVDVSGFADTVVGRQLAYQRERAELRPLGISQVIGSHNAFNSRAYDATLSGMDANHQLSMSDQLDMGVRSLELDLHWLPTPFATTGIYGGYDVVLCHGNDQHFGCTAESQVLDTALAEIRGWLDTKGNKDELVILELQNELYSAGVNSADLDAHVRAATLINKYFPGNELYRPDASADGCGAPLPLATSIAQMKATGARAVVFSGCRHTAVGFSGFNDLVFDNSSARRQSGLGGDHFTDGAYNYTYASGCEGPFGPVDPTNWTRSWDDTTLVSIATAGGRDWVADDEIIGHWVDCGMNMPSLDDIAPYDPRMASFVWSWADGVKPRAKAFVRMDDDGRWRGLPNHGRIITHVVCSDADSVVIQHRARPGGGFRALHNVCKKSEPALGMFTPATGWENLQLRDQILASGLRLDQVAISTGR